MAADGTACASEQFPLHVDEMPPQGMDPELLGEVVVVRRAVLLPAHEQFGHVPEIVQRVVHRRGREQEHLLLAARAFDKVEQFPVAGRTAAVFARVAGIAEMVCLVDDDDIGQFLDALEVVLECFLEPKIGMVEDDQAAEHARAGASDMRQVVAKLPFPNIHPGRLGDEQRHALAVVHHQPLDDHQADERLAQAHAVAQERAAELPGDLHQGVVALLLVMVQNGVHAGAAVLRACRLPLVGGQAVAAAELVQRTDVDLEGACTRGCAAR